MYTIFVHEVDGYVIVTITIESLVFGRTSSFSQYLYSESEYTYEIVEWAPCKSTPPGSAAFIRTISSMKTPLSEVFL